MFEDRQQAGLLLARALAKYQGKEAVIFALPRGGVAVGSEIARCLKLPLDIVISRKIGQPLNPEYAIAAVSESGFLVENEIETQKVDERWLERAVEVEMEEAKRRRRVYSAKSLPKTLRSKIAIIVDDGLATGLTLKAAIKEIRSLKPEKIIVAVPVAPEETVDELKKSIGAYYRKFPQLTDKEVVSFLKTAD
jgi:putative phosphoribosyl transferase